LCPADNEDAEPHGHQNLLRGADTLDGLGGTSDGLDVGQRSMAAGTARELAMRARRAWRSTEDDRPEALDGVGAPLLISPPFRLLFLNAL
jgi:hypothetical protein